tara:strand:+ start:41595 stop:42623 length:1029 start_codon:yes stop_codon:yes gene_type:complete
MKIIKGTVVSNVDDDKQGTLKVIFPSLSQGAFDVTYTSPMYMLNNGGMLAIPEEGSRILAALDEDGDGKIYYMSTIVDTPDTPQAGGLKVWNVVGDTRVYSDRKKPQKVSYANQAGAGVHITRKFLPSQIVAKTDLTSEKGKMLSLNDSPKSDAVILRNEHGDGLLMFSEGDEIHSERSIEMKSKGSQKFVVYQSDLGMYVIDGRDINIENHSTGAFAGPGNNRFGNVNLRSKNADVTLVSKAEDGRIFLVTPKARIQIAADGSIQIHGTGDVQITSDANINLNAAQDVNIKGTNVNIKADANIATDGGSVNSMQGAQIHFNSGYPANEAPTTPPEPTSYEE